MPDDTAPAPDVAEAVAETVDPADTDITLEDDGTDPEPADVQEPDTDVQDQDTEADDDAVRAYEDRTETDPFAAPLPGFPEDRLRRAGATGDEIAEAAAVYAKASPAERAGMVQRITEVDDHTIREGLEKARADRAAADYDEAKPDTVEATVEPEPKPETPEAPESPEETPEPQPEPEPPAEEPAVAETPETAS